MEEAEQTAAEGTYVFTFAIKQVGSCLFNY